MAATSMTLPPLAGGALVTAARSGWHCVYEAAAILDIMAEQDVLGGRL
jgi:hypothetical protein